MHDILSFILIALQAFNFSLKRRFSLYYCSILETNNLVLLLGSRKVSKNGCFDANEYILKTRS